MVVLAALSAGVKTLEADHRFRFETHYTLRQQAETIRQLQAEIEALQGQVIRLVIQSDVTKQAVHPSPLSGGEREWGLRGEGGVIDPALDGQATRCERTYNSREFGVAIAESLLKEFPCGTPVRVFNMYNPSPKDSPGVQAFVIDTFPDTKTTKTSKRIANLTQTAGERINLTLDEGLAFVFLEKVRIGGMGSPK